MTPEIDFRSSSPVTLAAMPIVVDGSRRSDLFDMLAIVLRRKWIVLAVGIAAAAAMLVYLNVTTYRYNAELKVTSVQVAGSGLGGSLQKLGALGSIANLQLPQDSSSIAFLRYGELLRSPDLAQSVAGMPTVMHVLFYKEWDTRQSRWVEPTGIVITVSHIVKSLLGFPVYAWQPPDALRVEEYLDRWVSVAVDQKRPVITIDYQNRDPIFAGTLVSLLHQIADEALRKRSLARSALDIEYLTGKLKVITLAEHRAVLSEALAEQERTQMSAQVGTPFAAEPIGKVKVSSRPTSPLPGLYLAGALAGGLLSGALFVLVAAQLRARRERSAV